VSCVRKQNRCEVKRQCCKFFGASVFVIVEITVLYVYTLIKTISNIKIKHAQVSDCATYSDSAAWCDVSNSTKDTRQCTHQLRVGVETCRESRWSLTDRRIQGQTLLLITCLLLHPSFFASTTLTVAVTQNTTHFFPTRLACPLTTTTTNPALDATEIIVHHIRTTAHPPLPHFLLRPTLLQQRPHPAHFLHLR
jgi:hypothetical protein